MTDKDPNDMTASELLRSVVAALRNGYNAETCIDKLRTAVGSEEDNAFYSEDMRNALTDLARMIDAELAQARNESLLQGAQVWAKANGWPDFKPGEDFGEWLNRCALPRPRYEDGEIANAEDFGLGCAGYFTVHDSGEWHLKSILCNDDIALGFAYERVKRPVLGADGLPIVEGEMVYPIDGEWLGIPLEVSGIDSPASVKVYLSAGKSWTTFHADRLTHTPPDTQERIDREKMVGSKEYWSCTGISCMRCPSKIDGELPSKHYGVRSCSIAQGVDIARRQRELDARTGGAE